MAASLLGVAACPPAASAPAPASPADPGAVCGRGATAVRLGSVLEPGLEPAWECALATACESDAGPCTIDAGAVRPSMLPAVSASASASAPAPAPVAVLLGPSPTLVSCASHHSRPNSSAWRDASLGSSNTLSTTRTSPTGVNLRELLSALSRQRATRGASQKHKGSGATGESQRKATGVPSNKGRTVITTSSSTSVSSAFRMHSSSCARSIRLTSSTLSTIKASIDELRCMMGSTASAHSQKARSCVCPSASARAPVTLPTPAPAATASVIRARLALNSSSSSSVAIVIACSGVRMSWLVVRRKSTSAFWRTCACCMMLLRCTLSMVSPSSVMWTRWRRSRPTRSKELSTPPAMTSQAATTIAPVVPPSETATVTLQVRPENSGTSPSRITSASGISPSGQSQTPASTPPAFDQMRAWIRCSSSTSAVATAVASSLLMSIMTSTAPSTLSGSCTACWPQEASGSPSSLQKDTL
mmetsp:Transcript_7886/g.24738  ORF Transcript_7886/g.24738 Transcript_7886/m.24738 type:complete len:474 (-) Transcript_7886:854-2275(-)